MGRVSGCGFLLQTADLAATAQARAQCSTISVKEAGCLHESAAEGQRCEGGHPVRTVTETDWRRVPLLQLRHGPRGFPSSRCPLRAGSYRFRRGESHCGFLVEHIINFSG